MKGFLSSLIAWGSSGLFMGALLDGMGLPIPGGVDVLIIFLSSQLPDQAMWLAFVAVLGSVAGNYMLFLLARRGGKAFIDKRSASKRSQRFRRWFDRYGLSTVFVASLVPLPVMPLKIFVLSSGALGSQPIRFLLSFTAARIPRYVGLALLGRAMGNNAIDYLRLHVWDLVLFAVALLLLLMVVMRYVDKSSASATATE